MGTRTEAPPPGPQTLLGLTECRDCWETLVSCHASQGSVLPAEGLCAARLEGGLSLGRRLHRMQAQGHGYHHSPQHLLSSFPVKNSCHRVSIQPKTKRLSWLSGAQESVLACAPDLKHQNPRHQSGPFSSCSGKQDIAHPGPHTGWLFLQASLGCWAASLPNMDSPVSCCQ